MMFIILLFIFQICFFETLISGDDELFEKSLEKNKCERIFLDNQNKIKEIRVSRPDLNKKYNTLAIKYKFNYQYLSYFSSIGFGLLFFSPFFFLIKKDNISSNYKNIFSICFLSSLFLPLVISVREAKKIHYSFTYENMLNDFEKLKVKVFTKNIFSLIDRKTIFIDYYENFFKKTDTLFTLQGDDINKYKVLMNFFLAKDESAKKEIIKKYFQYVIMIDQDRGIDAGSIFFPEYLNKSLILELSDEQCLKIIKTYYKDKIDSIVDAFNEIYSKEQKKIKNILSDMNEDILLKIVLNQKLSQKIYTYIMENFRYEIVHEINKKYGEVSRIAEEVEFSNNFEIYENNKREIENAQKQEEQEVRAFCFNKLDIETIFEKNINNHIAFSRLIYNNFFYDYLPIVNFFKNCKRDDNIAEILSLLFYYARYFISDKNKDSKELFFKIITSPNLGDRAKKIIFSQLFTVLEKDFESILNLKFCYGKTEAVRRYHELLTELESKNKILF